VEDRPASTERSKEKKMRKGKPKRESSEEYQNFEKLAKALIAVPKSEMDKREAEYQRAKKLGKKRRAHKA